MKYLVGTGLCCWAASTTGIWQHSGKLIVHSQKQSFCFLLLVGLFFVLFFFCFSSSSKDDFSRFLIHTVLLSCFLFYEFYSLFSFIFLSLLLLLFLPLYLPTLFFFCSNLSLSFFSALNLFPSRLFFLSYFISLFLSNSARVTFFS